MTETDATPRNIAVVGIGNLDRGDDAVGRIVARRVKEQVPPTIAVIESAGGVADVIDAIAGVNAAIVVDAVCSGSTPGHIHRIDAAATSLPASWFGASTHGFGVAEAIELGRTLGTLPPTLIFYGIESTDFSHGTPLSDAVGPSIDAVITHILEDVASISR